MEIEPGLSYFGSKQIKFESWFICKLIQFNALLITLVCYHKTIFQSILISPYLLVFIVFMVHDSRKIFGLTHTTYWTRKKNTHLQ